MTFRLSIPGRDEIETPTVANPAIPLIGEESINRLARLAAIEVPAPAAATARISKLAGLADIADSIEVRQLAADLIQAAMRVCDRYGDDDAARQEMREQCLELPPHLQADLLEHFTGKRRNFTKG